MAKPDYDFQASVVVGCQGSADGLQRSGPAGSRTPRDGARLDNGLADSYHWAGEWEPGGLAILPDERYAYVADTNNHRLRVIDPPTGRVGTLTLGG